MENGIKEEVRGAISGRCGRCLPACASPGAAREFFLDPLPKVRYKSGNSQLPLRPPR